MNEAAPQPGALQGPGLPSVFVLALTLLLAAGLGVPSELMLQDTFKSMVVAAGVLLAALLFCWELRKGCSRLFWHGVLALPALLLAHALGSMAWSHSYLAAGEAIRWFILGLLLWLGLNTLTRERVPLLAMGVHLAAVLASLWAALQFWFDFALFPQAFSPASSFVNRNFLAEFLVCALPFSVLLLARAVSSSQIRLMSVSTGLCVLALLMTGTRSASLTLLLLGLALPGTLWACRAQLEMARWRRAQAAQACALLLATVLGLGLIPCGNASINAEVAGSPPVSALQRSAHRTASVTQATEYRSGSFSLRLQMWQATARMIAAHPLRGVGAGAWEVEIPRFLAPGSQLETDYYAHNEVLQLLAEYGLVGWAFVLGLLAYLGRCARRTWSERGSSPDAPQRAMALASLLALLLVSCAGFPLHLACTGAMLALGLSVLAASDARSDGAGNWGARSLPATRPFVAVIGTVLLLCLALAAWIGVQAALCERKIVRAVDIGLTISRSGQPRSPAWAPAKARMLQLMREGIAINPHYRKLTPILADELARWGDWENAIWIWQSVIESRPHVVVILSNIARGHVHLNRLELARAYLVRAQALHPQAVSVRTLEALLLYREGRDAQAAELARSLMGQDLFDEDVLTVGYELGRKTGDRSLALLALELRKRRWPEAAPDCWLKMGELYDPQGQGADPQALHAYREAMAAAPPALREALRRRIPRAYRERL